MAGASLFALLDDISALLDDVSVLTKVAAKETAGVLGDDLALNAQQVAGVSTDRELPVVWAVAKGSARNKLMIVPAALAISALVPWGVTPILMLGGTFLCFEGFEKVLHALLHRKGGEEEAEEIAHHREHVAAMVDPTVDVVKLERDKIRGAIRTDIILSAEIIVITLGTVATEPFFTRLAVLSAVAAIMTVGVYGFVAGIVKLDDLGLALTRRQGSLVRKLGRGILSAAPYLMKALTIAGTIAMFLVGGGILVHGMPPIQNLADDLRQAAGPAGSVAVTAVNAAAGICAGALAYVLVSLVKRVRRTNKAA